MADNATTSTTTDAAAESSGDSTQAPATEAATTAAEQQAATAETALGDAGKKAIDAMKAERNQFRDDFKTLKAEFDAFRAKAEGKEAEHQRAIEAQKVKDEALAAANARILKSEVRATAAGKLADPADALRYLDLSSFEVNDDGEADSSKIASAIDDLIKSKPYLAAQGVRFQGSADGGVRNDANAKPQLSEADLSRMTPEAIDKARKDGQLNDLLGIK